MIILYFIVRNLHKLLILTNLVLQPCFIASYNLQLLDTFKYCTCTIYVYCCTFCIESSNYVIYKDDPLTTPLMSSSFRCSCSLAFT